MNNPVPQGLFFDDPSRSPGSQRQSAQLRQVSAPFESYGRGNMNNASYFGEEQDSRFDGGREHLGRLNTSMGGGGAAYNPYDSVAAQTWNPNAFSNNAFAGNVLGGSSRASRPLGRGGRAAPALPSTWMDQPMNMASMSGFGTMPPPALGNHSLRPDAFQPEVDDELIPTAIVIKNIPFAVRKEELVDVMTNLSLPLPYAFNYHFDNGVFRGLAFANFTSAEETAIVIEALNHFELNGRKLRVEYKKMLPLQERERIEREKRERRGQLEEQHRPMATPSLHNPPSLGSLNSQRNNAPSPSPVEARALRPDLNDPQTLQFYNEILLFKGDNAREMLVFPSTLTAMQRRTVHTLAHMMGLGHQSTGAGDQRQVYVQRAPITGNNVSPPVGQAAMLQPDPNRRTLNRAATTDFSEARGQENHLFGTLRGQHSTGFLGLPDSPGGFANSNNLRAAKSFADLRSYTPSPVPSTASYPVGMQSNLPRVNDGASGTPTLTPTASNNPLGQPPQQQQRGEDILNGLGSLSLGGGSLGPAGSPRRVRGMFSWDREQNPNQANPSPAPIGSNRAFSTSGFQDDSRERLAASQTLPIRQPRGPAPERAPGFARTRPNGQGMGHQPRGSDELSQRGQQQQQQQQQQQPQGHQQGGNVEIIVEH